MNKSTTGNAANPGETGKEYLTFSLGGQFYAADILQVQEIREYQEPTRIAAAPAYVKGVVNLRGVIVPIVDLRLKLDLGPPTYDNTTAVIVVSVNDRVTGFVVDSVIDVTSITSDQMRPTPTMALVDSMAMVGIAIAGERTLLLIDLQKLVPTEPVV